MDTQRGNPICESSALVDGGTGVRCTWVLAGQPLPAFVVRHGGTVFVYLNRCAHRGVELDWEHGRFFDLAGRWLMCATHGALYDPASGSCVGGPCRGARLVAVPVTESDGKVWLGGGDKIHSL